MSDIFYLPWGIAGIIQMTLHFTQELILIVILTALEIALIYFEVYPRFIRIVRWPQVNAVIFYFAINLISNISVTLYLIGMVGRGSA